ncbi:hypothetical protein ACLOJK_012094 [Asimina triloba]
MIVGPTSKYVFAEEIGQEEADADIGNNGKSNQRDNRWMLPDRPIITHIILKQRIERATEERKRKKAVDKKRTRFFFFVVYPFSRTACIFHALSRVSERQREMAVGLSLNALVRLPLSNSRTSIQDNGFPRTWSSVSRPARSCRSSRRRLVVEAKGKKGMQSRTFQRPPPLPKIEDDGNPKFVIFIRSDNVSVYLWYPLSIITGGTTAKIMVAAKDNFVGKYLYKDTIARNLAAVIYKENGDARAALSTSDVIELPTQDELKTVVDKVKDFFGGAASNAKESFGKLTSLTSITEESEEKSDKRIDADTSFIIVLSLCDLSSVDLTFIPAADSKIRSIGGEKVISGRCHVGIMSAEPVGNYGVRSMASAGILKEENDRRC